MGSKPKNARPSRRDLVVLAVLVLAALAVRLIGINQPFVDSISWRQADMGMIAENLFRNGYDIFHPQVNWSPDTTGVVGTEFPLAPLLAALLYKVFGIREWIGRAIPVIFFLMSMPFFFGLVARLANVQTALLAVAFYAFTPLAIITSRTFLSDPVSLSLSVIGFYYLVVWLDSDRFRHLVLAAILMCGSILVKAPYALLLAPMASLIIQKFGWNALRSKAVWFLAFVALAPSAAWYAYALWIPTATPVLGGKAHFFGEQGVGIAKISELAVILQQNWWPFLTPVIIIPAIAGICLLSSRVAYRHMVYYWLGAMALFIAVDGHGNSEHRWYQLPLLPVFALLAAGAVEYAIRRAPSKLRGVPAAMPLIIAALLISISYRVLPRYYASWNPGAYEAAKKVDQIAPADALVLTADEGNPSCMYYTRRKGWHFWNPDQDTDAIASLERYRKLGARYLILDQYHVWWLENYPGFAAYLNAKYRGIARSERYAIFDLTPLQSDLVPLK